MNGILAKLVLMTGPVAVVSALSFIVAYNHQISLRDSRCSLSLPWDLTTAQALIQRLNPAAWAETEKITVLSGQCVAGLHSLSTSAYTLLLIACVLCTTVATIFTPLNKDYVESTPSKSRIANCALLLCMGLILIVGMGFFIFDVGIINFGNEARRIMIHFVRPYINPFDHWRVFMGVIILSSLGAGAFVTGIKLSTVKVRAN